MSLNRRFPRFLSAAFAAVELLLYFGNVPAARSQEQTIAQMVRTVWTGRDGAPSGIRALAQTPDGLLWIASLKGLYSFDGRSFVAFQPNPGSPAIPARSLRILLVSRTGDLWVAGYHGPAARIRNGEVTVYDRREGGPVDALDYLQQDASGAMWAVADDHQLVRLGPDGSWRPMPDPLSERGHIYAHLIDSTGTQWVVENNTLFMRPEGQHQFVSTGVTAFLPAKMREGANHTLWVMAPVAASKTADPSIMRMQQIDRAGRRVIGPVNVGAVTDLLPANNGSLWILKANDELVRVQTGQLDPADHDGMRMPPDSISLSPGIGIQEFHAFMRDGDGNVWAGGLGALERFAHASLVPVIPAASPGIWCSCVDPRGAVYVSSPRGELYRLQGGNLARLRVTSSGNLFCAPDGTVYMEADGITTLHGETLGHVPLLPGLQGYGENYIFTGLLPTPDGGLIAAASGTVTGKTLWMFRNHQWSRYLPSQKFPGEVTAMFVDSHDIIYLGHSTGDVTLVNGDAGHTLRSASSQFAGILGFAETSYGVFAHGALGVALVRTDRLQVIRFANQEYSKNVTGLVQSRNGDIWINGFDGVARIQSAEIRAALAELTHAVTATNFQEGDFKGPSMPLLFSSTAHIDPSGTLWFSTLNGAISVDPRHLSAPTPPHVIIRSVTADGGGPSPRGEFPPHVSTVDVHYLGVNLTNPDAVVYRYRLDGVDGDWVDAGHRTDAIYTRLRPGRYVFHLIASNGDGTWTDPVTAAPFVVRPGFYQTWWFATLSALASAVLAWFVVSSRFRSISQDVRVRAEERADERIRIARDLHDTLLQGIQGLLLTFHVAAQKVPPDHESRSALEKALSTADRIILEGRNRVTRLRSDHLTDAELIPSLECFASDLNGEGTVQCVVERRGGTDRLENHVVDEIFSIAREAMTNSFRHAQASRITNELEYGTRTFRLSCRDNGRGFNADDVFTAATDGHWGLRGMAERAKNIGAAFACRSAPAKGTEIIVSLPARRAYVRASRFRRWLRR